MNLHYLLLEAFLPTLLLWSTTKVQSCFYQYSLIRTHPPRNFPVLSYMSFLLPTIIPSTNPQHPLGFPRHAPEPLGRNIGLQYDDGAARELRHQALRPIRQPLVRHKSKTEL